MLAPVTDNQRGIHSYRRWCKPSFRVTIDRLAPSSELRAAVGTSPPPRQRGCEQFHGVALHSRRTSAYWQDLSQTIRCHFLGRALGCPRRLCGGSAVSSCTPRIILGRAGARTVLLCDPVIQCSSDRSTSTVDVPIARHQHLRYPSLALEPCHRLVPLLAQPEAPAPRAARPRLGYPGRSCGYAFP
jgi:hypothetical protein